jgi:hypothetical protein
MTALTKIGLWLAIVSPLFLYGCGPTKTQQEAACYLDAWKFVAIHGEVGQERAGMTATCMEAKGYRIENGACPPDERTTPDMPLDIRLSENETQDEDPQCYVLDW